MALAEGGVRSASRILAATIANATAAPLMMQTGQSGGLGTAGNAAIMYGQLDACAELGQHSLAAAKSVARA
ncbi:hypothetical protein HME01_11200 [Vreelandella aquamarina]|nr:hypothetical protein HME01_11200 [Halomonas meridiana]